MILVTTFCGKRTIHDCIKSSFLSRRSVGVGVGLRMKCYVVYKSEAWHRMNIIGFLTWEVNRSEDGHEWATMVIASPLRCAA
jgi:hypothetical protein